MGKKVTELTRYVLLFAVLLLMAVVPLFAVILLPVALALLLWLYARHHVGLPLWVCALYPLLAWPFGPNVLHVAVAVMLPCGFAALAPTVGRYGPLAGASAGALGLLVALLAVTGAFSLAHRCSPQELTYDCVIELPDPVIGLAATVYYDGLTDEQAGGKKPQKGTEAYDRAAREAYAAAVKQEADEQLYWYLSGIAVFGGLAAYLLLLPLLRRTQADRTRYAPTLRLPTTAVRDLRLPRSYLWVCLLPALAFSALSAIALLRPITRAVFNVLITLPCAFAGFTVLLHTCYRAQGRLRAWVLTLLGVAVAAAMVFYDWGLLVLSLLGLADCVLDLRKLLSWALD